MHEIKGFKRGAFKTAFLTKWYLFNKMLCTECFGPQNSYNEIVTPIVMGI